MSLNSSDREVVEHGSGLTSYGYLEEMPEIARPHCTSLQYKDLEGSGVENEDR